MICSFNLIHYETAFKVDIFIRKLRAFDTKAGLTISSSTRRLKNQSIFGGAMNWSAHSRKWKVAALRDMLSLRRARHDG